MKEIFSRLSLYDILAMLIPGGTILTFIALSWNFELYFDTSKVAPTLAWTIMLTLAYLIGIVNHIVTSVLWSPFRNNLEMINEAGKVVDGVKGEKSNRVLVYYCIALLITMIALICWFFCCCKWNDCACWIFVVLGLYMIIMVISLFKNRRKDSNKKKEDEKEKEKEKEKLMDAYYRSYYFALKNSYSNDIPRMEGQVAFMQSMIIPLLLLILLPKDVLSDYIFGYECCVRGLVISLIVLMVLAIILRQRKIYERVWEDAKFLKLLQQKNADKNC